MVRDLIPLHIPILQAVKDEIGRINENAATGPDGINIALIREGGDTVHRVMHEICVSIWTTRRWPQEFGDAFNVPVPKKAGAKTTDDHRGVSITAHVSKVMTGILHRRMVQATETLLGHYQFGCRSKLGTDDADLALRLMMDRMREQGRELYIGYIDLVKAVDTVNLNMLFDIMTAMGFPKQLVSIIRNLYSQTTRFKVKTVEGTAEEWVRPL